MFAQLPNVATLATHLYMVFLFVEVIFYGFLRFFFMFKVGNWHSPIRQRQVIPLIGQHIEVPSTERAVVFDDNLLQFFGRRICVQHHTIDLFFAELLTCCKAHVPSQDDVFAIMRVNNATASLQQLRGLLDRTSKPIHILL